MRASDSARSRTRRRRERALRGGARLRAMPPLAPGLPAALRHVMPRRSRLPRETSSRRVPRRRVMLRCPRGVPLGAMPRLRALSASLRRILQTPGTPETASADVRTPISAASDARLNRAGAAATLSRRCSSGSEPSCCSRRHGSSSQHRSATIRRTSPTTSSRSM